MKSHEVPKFLLKFDFMIGSVAFIAIFSILFMLIYTPFSVAAWFDIFDGRSLSMTVMFYVAAVALMMISKVLMVWVQNRITVTTYIYLLWLVGEVVAISLLYTVFTQLLVFHGSASDPVRITIRAVCCVTAILAIPYTISSLYAAYKSKKEESDIMRYRAKLLEGNVGTGNLISLYDGNGVVKLTIDIDSLYYMESQDNYVKICYENDGALHNYMLRCRTKTLEDNLADTPMVRCHRSYIINTTKIKLLRPDKSNNVVVLKHPDVKPIPVSKSYYDKLMKLIANGQTGHAGDKTE
ncbi:MAG: LytTR family transcriptional regulator DNA-binding domain-containing protein [Alistipes sp.]|nr:LytTR family transcriptional regulator DNA-binding domain-containing protein [Alistipes sp.]